MNNIKTPNATGIALLGCGTVGGKVFKILNQDSGLIKEKTGLSFTINGVTGRNKDSLKKAGIEPSLYRTVHENISDPKTDIVVELMGGTGSALQAVREALKMEKPVVTANKALMAEYGPELIDLAGKMNTTIAFEASCCGGIPIIRALTDGLLSNRIEALYGIVNGTCNYILTEMIQKGIDFPEALKEAQEHGLAEADPALDVSGMDSAQKLLILAELAFGQVFSPSMISVKGIDSLDRMDADFAAQLGYVVKLLAIASRIGKGICLRVRPSFITTEHPLAWVSGPFNAVSVYGNTTGHTMYYGRGAGGDPTASAVISDILSTASGTENVKSSSLRNWIGNTVPANSTEAGEITGRYYIRVLVKDQPGTLGRITTILGKHTISIASFLQHELPELEYNENGCEFFGKVPIVLTTHTVKEKNVANALKEIEESEKGCGGTVFINIVDEHPERI
jgi:homoserine dehydrogenase